MERTGKEYRITTTADIEAVSQTEAELAQVFADVPFGIPDEPIAGKDALGIRVPLYGFDRWSKLFTPRQLLSIGTFVKWTRCVRAAMESEGYGREWIGSGIAVFFASAIDRLVDYSSTQCVPDPTPTQSGIRHTFSQVRVPMTWDFMRRCRCCQLRGFLLRCGRMGIASMPSTHSLLPKSAKSHVIRGSAISQEHRGNDLISSLPIPPITTRSHTPT